MTLEETRLELLKLVVANCQGHTFDTIASLTKKLEEYIVTGKEPVFESKD